MAPENEKMPESLSRVNEPDPDPFKEDCFEIRNRIEQVKNLTMILRGNVMSLEYDDATKGEIIANIQLAYRHLEDARMRIGKAIQAYDGGTSCYPR